MKFYFVDDDKNIRTILKILVTERNLGECCGSSGNGDDALEDVAALHPDIIIVDLLCGKGTEDFSGIRLHHVIPGCFQGSDR